MSEPAAIGVRFPTPLHRAVLEAVGPMIPQALAASWMLSGTVAELHGAGGMGRLGAPLVRVPAVSIAVLRAESGR